MGGSLSWSPFAFLAVGLCYKRLGLKAPVFPGEGMKAAFFFISAFARDTREEISRTFDNRRVWEFRDKTVSRVKALLSHSSAYLLAALAL